MKHEEDESAKTGEQAYQVAVLEDLPISKRAIAVPYTQIQQKNVR